MSKITKNIPTLKQFMLRQEVLKLYRDILRTIKQIPDENNRKELLEWTRHDFRTNQHTTDELEIKMKLQHGRRSFNELKTSLELSGIIKAKS